MTEVKVQTADEVRAAGQEAELAAMDPGVRRVVEQLLALDVIGKRRWADTPPPPLDVVVEWPEEVAQGATDRHPYMVGGEVHMLVAPGGSGKTTALVQLAVAVASGREWLGHYPVARPGAVLLALGEEREDRMHDKVNAVCKSLELTPAERELVHARVAPLSLKGANPSLDQPGVLEGLLVALEGLNTRRDLGGWSLVVLDPASRFMGPDAETDNAAATRFVESLERLTAAPGSPAVVVAHHTHKGAVGGGATDQTAARGSSALTDGVRWQVNMESHPAPSADTPGGCTLRHVKSNLAKPARPLDLERGPRGVLRVASSSTRDAWEEARVQREAARKLQVEEHKTAVDKALKALKDKDKGAAAEAEANAW